MFDFLSLLAFLTGFIFAIGLDWYSSERESAKPQWKYEDSFVIDGNFFYILRNGDDYCVKYEFVDEFVDLLTVQRKYFIPIEDDLKAQGAKKVEYRQFGEGQ